MCLVFGQSFRFVQKNFLESMNSLTFSQVILFFLWIINLYEATPIKVQSTPDKIISNQDIALKAKAGLDLLANAAEMVDRMDKASEQFPFHFSPIKRPSTDQVRMNHKRRMVIKSIPRALYIMNDDVPGEVARTHDPRVISPLSTEFKRLE